jgi:spoIIIJ-associated protein
MERSSNVEVSARSVNEAIDRALEELGLNRDQVEVEVLKQGSRGLLGLLREDAVVRVTPKVEPSAPTALAPEPSSAVEPEEEAVQAPLSTRRDEIGQIGVQVLQQLLDYMGLEGRVSREDRELMSQAGSNPVRLNITGQNLSGLIGRRGETLRDLQYLTCLLVSRRIQRWPDLLVDVEDYKARRETSLIGLAERMADQVRRTGQSVPLEPMPAHERRIVHLALRDDPDVYTESFGQDEKRKVVILPKK